MYKNLRLTIILLIAKNNLLLILIFGLISIKGNAQQTEMKYLSGLDKDNTVEWDFFCTKGMNSGKWSKIQVPSCWELQGFGTYNYGRTKLEDQSDEKGLYKYSFKADETIYETILEIENQLESSNKLTPLLREILFNGKTTYIYYLNREKGNRHQSRDEIMASRISFLSKNGNNKIIVWAHDAHISNEIIADNEIGVMGKN